MDSVFVKLTSGTRITNHMGLRMEQDRELKHGKNYLYIEIPLSVDNEFEIKRNQHVFIKAACTINVKGRDIVLVEPNPALAEYGQVQAPYMIHPDSGEIQVGFWFTGHKQVQLVGSELYAVRIYMYA